MAGRWFILLILTVLLCGCVSGLWTGASLAYDRYSIYKKINDFEINTKVNQALYQDNVLKQPACHVEMAVFNRDILLAGHVNSKQLRDIAIARARSISGSRTLYIQLELTNSTGSKQFEDEWITTKIRSAIFADSNIPPKDFKIVTVDGTVYIMGDVVPDHAEKVVEIARDTEGVKKIVKLMKYYKLV